MDCPTLELPPIRIVNGGYSEPRERILAGAWCRSHSVNWRDRALAAEKQLAALAESGTGYSQQTVDAIVKERDALRGIVARVRRELGDRCHLGCTDRFCVTVTRLHDILDDKETP